MFLCFLRDVLYPFFNKPREHYDCLIAFVVHLAIAVTITFFLWLAGLLLTLIIPYFIAAPSERICFTPSTIFPAFLLTTMPAGLTTKPRWNPPVI
jgi:hypothetical protein